MGVPNDADDAEHPKYGYLADGDQSVDEEAVEDYGVGYGAYTFQLKDEVSGAVGSVIEESIRTQTALVESWSETMDWALDDPDDGLDGVVRAYEVWMDAAADGFERVRDAAEGDEVDVEGFRDAYLRAANDAASEMLETNAFAAATGQSVAEALDAKQRADESAEETLHIGLATEGDVREVGERLVELERRQHAVEEKLDRVLDALTDGDA
jgi:hypothetical protein